MTLFLVHGGLWEPMDAERFWTAPGVTSALCGAGHDVLAPDRLVRAPSWEAEAEHLAGLLPDGPTTVIGASNGCNVAVRLATLRPVARLLLAWPATAGDERVDTRTRNGMRELGADEDTIDGLLSGTILRGVTDDMLTALTMPVAVLPSTENPYHQRHTADALLAAIPHATELPACPEPPRPEFGPHLPGFVTAVSSWLTATAH